MTEKTSAPASVPSPSPGPEGRVLAVPELSLVVLVGASGSGKSTFARRHFLPTQVISSDFCRGLVADDSNDQSASPAAFDVLHYIAGKRLAAGRLTVVDATNVQQSARAGLVELARAHDVLPVAIVLDLPERVCIERNATRPDRDFGPHVVRRHRADLRRSLRSLRREGFRVVHVLTSQEEVDAATVRLDKLLNDAREVTGPFDVIGDVHGCLAELEALLGKLGYELRRDDAGRGVGARHPGGRRAVFVGDLVDRGPDTPGVLRLVMGMVAAGEAFAVPGNHEQKLVRALRGKAVKIGHGLAESLAQLAEQPPEFTAVVEAFCDGLVSHLVFDGGGLVVAHAGLKEAYHGRASGRVRSFALYGDTTGETDEFGLPIRYPWARDYRGRAMVLYGHTPVPEPEWVNNTLCVDTGCVFGGRLTALRYPERELVSVPAAQVYFTPARPFPAAAPGSARDGQAVDGGTEDDPAAIGATANGATANGATPATRTTPVAVGAVTGGHGAGRPADLLDITDVLGRRIVETRLGGRVTVREENALAALEVMSRFAVDPRWLVYLPPTMSPVATSQLPGLLEHPAEAFDAYRADGVAAVLCEEKHMGSRAVVVLCRDAGVAAARFGATNSETGVVFTRTGRPFFPPEPTEDLLGRLREAARAAGLWDELGAGWLLLDAEIMPWSVKAQELLRRQYAAAGAAARSALPVAVDVLGAAADRGIDVGELLGHTRERLANAEAFTDAYRRYCWPVDGLDGVKVAPFALLAAGPGEAAGAGAGGSGSGTAFTNREHAWHLEIADRLVAADPELVAPTRRLPVDTTDPASTARAAAWWESLTGAGGEGMVVKPAANLVRGARGLVQPGLKVRGREYLRIIYGPDYTVPANLDRVRVRGLGRKRSLAGREYALGLEALERAARGEPLWRVHECVFAILALESEPVDPRL